MPRKRKYKEKDVLRKAMLIFWAFGYEATNVRLLETEMGINQFSIYSSFKNKKNLYLESLRLYIQYMFENEFLELSKEGATISDLKKFLNSCIEKENSELKMNGCMIVNATCGKQFNDIDIQNEVKDFFTSLKKMLKQIIQNSITKKR